MGKPKIVNCYGGPGTGKSTCAAALFAELKYRGVNCEIITEFAKDATWEGRGPKVFQAQEYIFGKQHFRISRVCEQVDVLITDSPILMGIAYTPENFYLPSMKTVIAEAYQNYDNLDIFLNRKKKYNPKGRNQTEKEAKNLDVKIKDLLYDNDIIPFIVDGDRKAPLKIIERMQWIWGTEIPLLYNVEED